MRRTPLTAMITLSVVATTVAVGVAVEGNRGAKLLYKVVDQYGRRRRSTSRKPAY